LTSFSPYPQRLSGEVFLLSEPDCRVAANPYQEFYAEAQSSQSFFPLLCPRSPRLRGEVSRVAIAEDAPQGL